MKKYHMIVAALAFLVCLLSAYFGVRIHNANENFLLTDLNEFDKIYHDDISLVPALNRLAAVVTLPFLLGITILEILIIRSANVKQVKNIAYGLTLTVFIILTVDLLTIFHPDYFDFSMWGFVWVCLGLFLLVGNALSYFLVRFGKN
ncbi:MAG: hypothetical protein H6582_06350 [Crocinitomicaceae bacterium]|nr:hypothetical protein [Crocinitomicaceae bacterium]